MSLITRLKKEGWAVLPGGADISPTIYGKDNYKSYINSYSIQRDMEETMMYKEAVKSKRPIFGICRGMQLISALNGLTLIQDMSHGGSHNIKVFNRKTGLFDDEVYVNNAHHQCVWTENKTEGNNFKVYGYCSLSKYHHYQKEENIDCTVEPEIIYFPEVNALTTQFHPEWMDYYGQYLNTLNYLETIIDEHF